MEARDEAQLTAHLNASFERLPGPGYYQVLNWIHRALVPANYLEIGVNKGFSLKHVIPGTPTVGVDPSPSIEEEIDPATTIYELTSDDFFARYDLDELFGGPVELAFIDGLHLFEQVLRDFINVEKHSALGTVVLLHDCLPLDEATASREQTTDFYSGDVWKVPMILRRMRPELAMATVPTAPTGLCLVRGLDAGDDRLESAITEIMADYESLGFDYYLDHRDEMPEEIPNDAGSVQAWLKSTAVHS